jgi:hypothetical protein
VLFNPISNVFIGPAVPFSQKKNPLEGAPAGSLDAHATMGIVTMLQSS